MYLLFKFLLFPTAALAISGGHPAQSSKKYPFSVTLTSPILCGGSIISLDPPWILTAAHCIENLIVRETEQDYSIAYGDKDFAQQSYAAAKKTVLHPLYTTSHQVRSADRTESVPYDIGLIQLASPLKSNSVVNRIPISIDSSLNNTWLLETIGMGYTGYEQSYSDVLQYAQCSILQQENKFNHSVILATSNASLCHGDSGIILYIFIKQIMFQLTQCEPNRKSSFVQK
jgi:secreted trypsin-like serine protease